MRQWFQGRLEGHYVGRPQETAGAVHVPGGKHFTLKIYRAVVSDITLLEVTQEPAPPADDQDGDPVTDTDRDEKIPSAEPPVIAVERVARHHHEFEGPALHQELITEVQFEGALGRGRTVRGSAHDVLASDLSFSHPAEHDGDAYGRVEAIVSGWFRPPADPYAPVEVAPPREPGVVWRSEEIAGTSVGARTGAAPDSPSAERDIGVPLPLGTPFDNETFDESGDLAVPSEPEKRHLDEDWPFFTAGHLVTLAIMFGANVSGGLLFYLCYLPALGMRRWLRGVVPDGWLTQSIAMTLIVGETLLASLILAGFHEAGCKQLGAGGLSLLVGGVLMSSLLPRPLPFAVCLAALAGVLGQFYGTSMALCG